MSIQDRNTIRTGKRNICTRPKHIESAYISKLTAEFEDRGGKIQIIDRRISAPIKARVGASDSGARV